MAWRLSVSPVQVIAKAGGIKNPWQLSLRAGIAYHTARRWWFDDPTMTRLETDIMLKLADALDCEPGELVTRIFIDG